MLPWKASEEVFRVDHVGGVLSVLGVGGLVLTIEHADKGITPRWIAYPCVALFGQVAGRLINGRGSQFNFILGLGAVAGAYARQMTADLVALPADEAYYAKVASGGTA